VAAGVRDARGRPDEDRVTKRALTGAAVAAVYVAAAFVSYRRGLVPVRPLYEGSGPPPPYRWVTPPPDLAKNNAKPAGAEKIVDPAKGGYVNTADLQANLVVPPNGFVAKPGTTGVKITITPRDPAKIGPPPKGESYDGNAYEFTAAYVPTGEPAPVNARPPCPPATAGTSTCVSVVLRYAFSATQLYRRDGGAWTKLENTIHAGSAFQVYGDTTQLGAFVATQPFATPVRPAGKPWLPFVLGFGALLLGTLAARIGANRRKRGGDKTTKDKSSGGKKRKLSEREKAELRAQRARRRRR
jgi:hypothetical protein